MISNCMTCIHGAGMGCARVPARASARSLVVLQRRAIAATNGCVDYQAQASTFPTAQAGAA